MPSYFTQARDVELSLLYYLDTSLTADWSGTTVVKTFKSAYAKDVNLPIVCVRLASTDTTYREVGATTLDNRYLLIVDMFTKSDGMRLDMSYYIKDKLKDGWVHYEHSHPSGSNTTLDRSANGRDQVSVWLTDTRVDPGDNADVKDLYRHSISVQVRKSS